MGSGDFLGEDEEEVAKQCGLFNRPSPPRQLIHTEREMDRDRADRGRGRLPCRLGTSGNVFRGGGKKTERMEKTSAPRGKEMNGWMGK